MESVLDHLLFAPPDPSPIYLTTLCCAQEFDLCVLLPRLSCPLAKLAVEAIAEDQKTGGE